MIILTLNIPPRHEEQALAELPELVADTGATGLAFIVRAHPEEPPQSAKISQAMGCFDRIRALLQPRGVSCGVLIQTLMGHGERSTPVSPEKFQRLVGADGCETPTQFCPFDAGFLVHAAAACGEIARHNPDFILLDDDVRLCGAPPLHFGCFCPLHLERYAAGEKKAAVEPEEVQRRLLLSGGEGVAVRRAWQGIQDESLLQLCRRVREAIDEINPQIRCGICVVSAMRPLTEKLAMTLAGGTRPLVRVGQAFYNERGAKSFPLVMASVAMQKACLPAAVETLSEADTYPQTCYSVSATALRAYIACTLLQGIDAADVWLSPTRYWRPEPKFRKMLNCNRDFFAVIRDIASKIAWQGPACLSSGDERTLAPWSETRAQAVPPPLWSTVFGRMGIPFQCNGQVNGNGHGQICTLDGIAVYGLTDVELERILSGSVLLDGQAAEILCRRGYGSWLGVDAVADTGLRCSYELLENPVVHGDAEDCHLLTARRDATEMIRLSPRSDEVLTPSWLMRTPWFQHPEPERVAPALTLFVNRAGGRVAVFAHVLARFSELLFMNSARRLQISGVLDWLSGDTVLRVLPGDDIYALYGSETANASHILALFNLNLDPVPELSFALPETGRNIHHLQRLNQSGCWEEADFSLSSGIVRMNLSMQVMQPVVLRWRCTSVSKA